MTEILNDNDCQTVIDEIDRLMIIDKLTHEQELLLERLVEKVIAYEDIHYPIDVED